MIADPRDKWTPIRWVRWKVTGTPLTDFEQWCVDHWIGAREKGYHLDFTRSIKLRYYSQLIAKYPPKQDGGE